MRRVQGCKAVNHTCVPQPGFWLRLNSGLAPKPESKDASGQNGDNGKENGNYRDYRGSIGLMEK